MFYFKFIFFLSPFATIFTKSLVVERGIKGQTVSLIQNISEHFNSINSNQLLNQDIGNPQRSSYLLR